MFVILALLTFLLISFYQRNNIKYGYSLYLNYKKLVDPESKYGHLFAIKSLVMLIVSSLQMFYSAWKFKNGYNNKQENKENKEIQEKFNKKYLKIPYKYREKDYFYLLKVPKGVHPLLSITDQDGENIEDILSPYLGPNLDCHGAKLTPNDFGYEKIIITTIFDTKVEFDGEDKICLQ